MIFRRQDELGEPKDKDKDKEKDKDNCVSSNQNVPSGPRPPGARKKPQMELQSQPTAKLIGPWPDGSRWPGFGSPRSHMALGVLDLFKAVLVPKELCLRTLTGRLSNDPKDSPFAMKLSKESTTDQMNIQQTTIRRSDRSHPV